MNKDIPAILILIIEYWVRTDQLTILYFGVQDSSIISNGWDLRSLSGFSANTWHHVRFVIDTTIDKYDSYLDGVLKDNQVDLPNPMDAVDQIQFNTSPSQVNYNVWWDAIGGNWDPNYNIGDNALEGLLLDFNAEDYSTTSYKLDINPEIAILGDVVIPFPDSGDHEIRVWGDGVPSDSIYFTTESQIVINSPEPITYTSGMDGYYLASYGFENDNEGSNPYGWTTIDDPSNTDVAVLSSFYGHNKVVKISDSIPTGYPQMYKTLDRTSGIIEFWELAGATNKRHYFSFADTSNYGIHFYMHDNGNFGYYDNGGWNNLDAYNANQWYHIKIEFDLSTDWHVWIDGASKDGGSGFSFYGSPTSLTKLLFNTDHGQTGANYYIDAVGFDWEPNYNIGDKLLEGLLIDFNAGSTTNLGYKLDSNLNFGILGDVVIPFPDSGNHEIKVWGEGEQSDSIIFSIENQITIVSPGPITHTSGVLGYYPATYGFENEVNNFIDVVSNYGTCEIVNSYTDHNKVLHVEDSFSNRGMNFRHSLDSPVTSGTVEFWFAMTDVYEGLSDALLFYSWDDSNNIGFYLAMSDGQFIDAQSNTAEMEYNTWYHIRIDFDCSEGINGRYTWYLNENRQYSDVEMLSSVVDITQLTFRGYSSSRGEGYFDAFGFSWDPDYFIHENLREGLKLSYSLNPSVSLEWAEYILDNGPKKELSGDKIFSLYDGGKHTLRIAGEDSNGDFYYSDTISYSSEPSGWNPLTLVGSTSEGLVDRQFPAVEVARLGFEIQSVYPFTQDPILSFSITKLSPNPTSYVVFRLYLDGALISENDGDRAEGSTYTTEIILNELRQRRGHQIIIEVEDEEGNGDLYKLDYVKVERLERWDIKEITTGEDTNTYTSYQNWVYDDNSHNLLVNLNTQHGAQEIDGEINAATPGFQTSITVQIDPDFDTEDWYGYGFIYHYYYIDTVSLQLRVLRPDGTYINWPGPVTYDFHVCKAAYEYDLSSYNAMDLLIDYVSLFFAMADVGDLEPWDTIFEAFDDIWLVSEEAINYFHQQINEDTKGKLIDITKIISKSLENNDYVNLKNFKESFLVSHPGGPRIEAIKFIYEKDGTKFYIEISKISD